ncbi:hypothetical protein HHI36_022365 [Cryptolaemus montrouzieri]|uniref:PHD-type domain-containing protein n=1 Tax=Cryptolaemus montrouzieri TaxID=559131 RepID=A0ABD2N0C5_9CUCU
MENKLYCHRMNMAPGSDVCFQCSHHFIVNTKYIECDSCSKYFQVHCVELKDQFVKIKQDCENIKWFCDGCLMNVRNRLKIVTEAEIRKQEVLDETTKWINLMEGPKWSEIVKNINKIDPLIIKLKKANQDCAKTKNGLSTNLTPLQQVAADLLPIVLVVTETHITVDIERGKYQIDGYNGVVNTSDSRNTGGVIIYIEDTLKYKQVQHYSLSACRLTRITIPSPDQSEAKVQPRALSPTISTIVPVAPSPKELELRKPKSGIIINETQRIDDYDSFDLVYRRQPRPGFEKEIKAMRKSKKKKKLEAINEEDERKDMEARMEKELLEHAFEDEGEAYTEAPTRAIGEDEAEGEGELTKVFRKKVEQLSKSTSFQAKDLGYETEEESEIIKLPPVGQLTQKFRRGSEIERFHIPPPKIKRGTLESHSFTKLNQPTLKDFFYGTIAGTMHQASEHFPERVKNNQGLTMPVSAYCYALLKHPSTWEEKDIDEIVECGNEMFQECIHRLHKHGEKVKIGPEDLPRYCFLLGKKIRFKLTEPQVTGVIKSDQRNVYNLTKGITIFFSKYQAGIFQTKGVNIGIWRDKYYYFFDARPRTKDLYPDPHGTALMANFYDIDAVISVLLDRCMLGNWPFAIIAIEAYSILDRQAPEERESAMDVADKATFSVLDERKAVLQGSFDLADKCFEFTRNKQALTMAVASLVRYV